MPELLRTFANVPFVFGGTSLLIVVVVAMDFFSQLQAHLMSHHARAVAHVRQRALRVRRHLAAHRGGRGHGLFLAASGSPDVASCPSCCARSPTCPSCSAAPRCSSWWSWPWTFSRSFR